MPSSHFLSQGWHNRAMQHENQGFGLFALPGIGPRQCDNDEHRGGFQHRGEYARIRAQRRPVSVTSTIASAQLRHLTSVAPREFENHAGLYAMLGEIALGECVRPQAWDGKDFDLSQVVTAIPAIAESSAQPKPSGIAQRACTWDLHPTTRRSIVLLLSTVCRPRS